MPDTYDRMVVLDNLKKIVALEKTKENMIIAYDSLDSRSDYMLESGVAGVGDHKTSDPVVEDVQNIEATMNDIETFINKVDLEIDSLKKENLALSGQDHQELMSELSGKSRDYVLGLEEEETRKSTL